MFFNVQVDIVILNMSNDLLNVCMHIIKWHKNYIGPEIKLLYATVIDVYLYSVA